MVNDFIKNKCEYGIDIYLYNKTILEDIINLLNIENLDINLVIDIVNKLADFIQYNNSKYESSKAFKLLADLLVNIIEEFNTLKVNEEINLENIITKLKLSMLELKREIIDIKVNVYFYGKDKYNILHKSLNSEVMIIRDINEYLNKDIETNYRTIDILILSEETVEADFEFELYFNDVIYYDREMNYLFNISEKIYYSNYDYNYLTNAIEESKSKDVESIVVGNSYPLTGIDASILDLKSVSMALSSQDLYYSYKLAELVINNNENIKRCIIGGGYYLVNHDLSKSKNEDAINRVKNVYYPILKDKHNSETVDIIKIPELKQYIDNKVIRYIFDLNYLDKYFNRLIYSSNKNYFNENRTREKNNMLSGTSLESISEDDKYRLGAVRAFQHNKLSKYVKTTDAYIRIFEDFIKFLESKNIEVVIVIFPNTKYYNEFLDKTFEIEFYRIIDRFRSKNFKLIDFSREGGFEEKDFIDFDHMSELGANKITNMINNILKYEKRVNC